MSKLLKILMMMLIAVLEKRLGLPLGNCDAYVNVAGGIKVTEPAVDLGLVLALISGYGNKPIPGNVVAFGEVGLAGEVRAVSQVESRVKEAVKLGFTKIILPAAAKKQLKDKNGVELVFVENIKDLKL